MNVKKPIRVAVIGMGGWAAQHQRALAVLEKEGLSKLVATSGRNPERYAQKMKDWDFAGRGVKVFNDYRKMLDELAGELDAVCIPTPIQTHAELHQLCVERGLAMILEKPPTLCLDEYERMMAVEQKARVQTEIPFLYIVDEMRQGLKRRILSGDFGPLRRVESIGFWPRSSSYFDRNAWGGKLVAEGNYVLDSSMGNALSHYSVNALYWAGREAAGFARPAMVDAEIYRGHKVENADTFFVRVQTDDGPEIRIAASHGCAWQYDHDRFYCENATITYRSANFFRVDWHCNRIEVGQSDWGDLFSAIFRNYFKYLLGESKRPTISLADTRPYVELYNLAYVAAGGIHVVPDALVDRSAHPDGGVYGAIRGVEGAAWDFINSGRLPAEIGGYAWAAAGGSATRADLAKFKGIIDRELAKQGLKK